MVDVIKPKEEWLVGEVFENKNCPHLIYPVNMWACSVLSFGRSYQPCSLNECPKVYNRRAAELPDAPAVTVGEQGKETSNEI